MSTDAFDRFINNLNLEDLALEERIEKRREMVAKARKEIKRFVENEFDYEVFGKFMSRWLLGMLIGLIIRKIVIYQHERNKKSN